MEDPNDIKTKYRHRLCPYCGRGKAFYAISAETEGKICFQCPACKKLLTCKDIALHGEEISPNVAVKINCPKCGTITTVMWEDVPSYNYYYRLRCSGKDCSYEELFMSRHDQSTGIHSQVTGFWNKERGIKSEKDNKRTSL